MNTVKSSNVIVEMDVSGLYYPIFCGKTAEFSQTQEVIEVTSVNSDVAREYEAGMTTATLNITGITILDNTGGRISILYLVQESIRRAVQTMRIRFIDDTGATLQIAFSALITNNTISRSVGTYSQAATSFIITGTPTLSAIIPPPGVQCVETPLYIDVVAGATSVSHASLQQTGVVILGVSRSGMVHNSTSGTPGNMEYKFTGGAGNGTVAFDPTNPFNSGEVIWILYKIT